MSDERKVWLNGELIPWEKATVPLLSHGFSRGSAMFDVFMVYDSPEGPRAFRMDQHLKRLQRSADLLGMEMAYSAEEIVQAVKTTVRANRLKQGIVKIMAYWGEEALIDLVLTSKLDLAIFTIPHGGTPGVDKPKNISACITKWRKLHPLTTPVEAKACANYLNGYLARKDARSRGFDLGLLAGTDGFMAEGSIESFFLVKDGVLKTPPQPGRILSSITRMSVLEAAPSIGIPVVEELLLPGALYAADEIFTCHTSIKVSPVERFEERRLEAPGPVTVKLMKLMDDVLAFKDNRFPHWFQPLS
jgi:branched-chain amino acid aminotransferase